MSRKIIGVTVGTTLPKPDFKQDDPSKGDYIKNKPKITTDDAIEIAVETGLISPVAAEDGSIYTDENGVLYSL